MNNLAQGYRGYIGSRAYASGDFPQNIQNLLIRTYCQKYKLGYLLSATEYMMPGCYMILEEVLSAIQSVDGIILFSIFMLPESAQKRQRIYQTLLSAGKTLHAALEDLAICSEKDIPLVEDILDLNRIAWTPSSQSELEDFLATPMLSSGDNTFHKDSIPA
jgi:sporadic carbohydrate cluster protein (TIGR04323 family)